MVYELPLQPLDDHCRVSSYAETKMHSVILDYFLANLIKKIGTEIQTTYYTNSQYTKFTRIIQSSCEIDVSVSMAGGRIDKLCWLMWSVRKLVARYQLKAPFPMGGDVNSARRRRRLS